jgi:Gas vesicle protein G
VGMFSGLLTLPLAPVKGVVWVAEQITDELERQQYDEDNIRRELLELELEYEEGVIDDEERKMREDALMERLAISQGTLAYPTPEVDDG